MTKRQLPALRPYEAARKLLRKATALERGGDSDSALAATIEAIEVLRTGAKAGCQDCADLCVAVLRAAAMAAVKSGVMPSDLE